MPQDEIWIRTNSSHAPLTNYRFSMTPGEKLRLKLVGLKNGKRLTLKPWSDNGVAYVSQHGPAQHLEQTVDITAQNPGTATIVAYEPGGNPDQPMKNCSNSTGRYSDCFPHLTIEVLNKIEFPQDLSDEQKGILLVLLAETTKPGHPRIPYVEEEAVQAMQLMRQALLNRLSFSHPHYLQVPKNNPTLLGLIAVPGVIDGFSGYPALAGGIQNNIDALFKNANSGQHPYFHASRTLIQHAVTIAKGEGAATPIVQNVYAWKTAGSSSPASGYTKLLTLAGQDFYGLQQTYIDALRGKK